MMSLVNSSLNTASDISDIKNKRTSSTQELMQREQNNNYFINKEIDYQNTLSSMNQKREFWESQTLRKTTLPPHSSIFGIVAFDRCSKNGILKFELPVKDIIFNFQYHQKLIKP